MRQRGARKRVRRKYKRDCGNGERDAEARDHYGVPFAAPFPAGALKVIFAPAPGK
jgi:hypothetical protein